MSFSIERNRHYRKRHICQVLVSLPSAKPRALGKYYAHEDYNNDGEFFQEEGLQGSFEIDLSDEIGMEVDNEREVDEEGGDEVQNIQDLQLLERLRLGRDSEDDIPPSDSAGYVDIADSDDEDYDPANPDYDDYF